MTDSKITTAELSVDGGTIDYNTASSLIVLFPPIKNNDEL